MITDDRLERWIVRKNPLPRLARDRLEKELRQYRSDFPSPLYGRKDETDMSDHVLACQVLHFRQLLRMQ